MPRKPSDKKAPAPKQRKHPSYEEMIYKAISDKHSIKGSSVAAITHYILETYEDLPSNDAVKIQIRLSLKRLMSAGSIEKVKASYKLANATKEKLKKEKKSTKAASAPKKTRSSSPKKVVPAPKKPTNTTTTITTTKSSPKKKTPAPKSSPKKSSPKKSSPKKAPSKPKTTKPQSPISKKKQS